MKELNGGVLMPDVWKLPTVGMWEKTCGKHPTQKPLRLLYRIVLASTRVGEVVLDPFAGSCTTGIAANLLGRKFVGIDQSKDFLDWRQYENAHKMESHHRGFVFNHMYFVNPSDRSHHF